MVRRLGEQIGVTISQEEIVNVRQLGAKNQKRIVLGTEIAVVRPLLISLTETVKPKVMKNLYKLVDADESFKRMSVKHDMTREERQKDKALREQAGNFRYVVRGLPWEIQISKTKVQQKEREERPT